jgi:phosphatidylglycerophosphate synthase
MRIPPGAKSPRRFCEADGTTKVVHFQNSNSEIRVCGRNRALARHCLFKDSFGKDTTMNAKSIPSTNEVVFRAARRVNQSLTASVEKRALQWMAVRAPGWVTSDQLTALGLSAQVGAGVCYALSRYNRYALLLVILCLVLNWLGDSMDGTLARIRRQQRPRYGFYVDHMVDIFGSVALMCGLGFSGFLHWQIAVAMLVAFLLLSSESYLATYTLSCFQLSQGIFGPTEIRILLIIGNLALLRSPYSTLFGHRMLLFDAGGTIAAVSMFTMAIVIATCHTAQLYRQEPLP